MKKERKIVREREKEREREREREREMYEEGSKTKREVKKES